MKFQLGQTVATPGALAALEAARELPSTFLDRHVSGDWGTINSADVDVNEFALHRGGRLMSSYDLSTGVRIWIITEADRSATTILLPDEY